MAEIPTKIPTSRAADASCPRRFQRPLLPHLVLQDRRAKLALVFPGERRHLGGHGGRAVWVGRDVSAPFGGQLRPSDLASFKIPTPFASCCRTFRSVALSIFGLPSFTP